MNKIYEKVNQLDRFSLLRFSLSCVWIYYVIKLKKFPYFMDHTKFKKEKLIKQITLYWSRNIYN